MQIVPQYIDVEDKIVGPLTWKHLGWIFGGMGIIVVVFLMFDTVTFFVIAIPVFLLTVTLAFYKPNGIPFIDFVGFGFAYLFRPKTYTWQRDVLEEKKASKKEEIEIATSSKKKTLTLEEIEAMSKMLDSGGKERNEKMQELMKRNINNTR